MKEEVLRFDRVTYREQGVTELSHFCLDIGAGEIVGLIPVNDTGLQSLLRLMTQNLPLHYGYIYYRGKLVNDWKRGGSGFNRISVIANRSGLADDLTVAENVFVLRHGFRKRIVHRRLLSRQLEPFLRDIGVSLSADAYPRELTTFHRFAAELVKAVVAGCRLIVLVEPGTVVSDARIGRLNEILRHYAGQGISFLYVSLHYEEVLQACDRAALMLDGQIAKVLPTMGTSPQLVQNFGAQEYTELVRGQERRRSADAGGPPALELRKLCYGRMQELSLTLRAGECVVVQDLNNHIFGDLISLLGGERAPQSGAVLVDGKPFKRRRQRDVAVIQSLPAETMVFPGMSYLDNLCFTMDERMPEIWRRSRLRQSVRQEYEPLLGAEVFDTPVEVLSTRQKYDLVYTRVLLQRPRVAVCVQPFMQADVEHRMHIWTLLNRLLEKGIAVMMLAVNLADSLSLADRLIRVKDGSVREVYDRKDFAALPQSVPWHDLWNRNKT